MNRGPIIGDTLAGHQTVQNTITNMRTTRRDIHDNPREVSKKKDIWMELA